MGNYFNELRWKIIRANNLLQFIYLHAYSLYMYYQAPKGNQ